MERSKCCEKLAFPVSLEAGPGYRVEDAVGTVAIRGRISAALCFEVIDILWVNLRTDVAGDIGIGDRDAVDGPCYLVPAAHVKLVGRNPGPRNVVGDRGQAVA